MNNLAEDLEFENQIREFDAPTQFLARQVRQMNRRCQECLPQVDKHEVAIHDLQQQQEYLAGKVKSVAERPRTAGGLSGGITGAAMAIAIAVLDYLRRG